jgi:hypothetical protein
MIMRGVRPCIVALLVIVVAGCAGGSEVTRESLANVDHDDAYWAIRSSCEGGSFSVDFSPGEHLDAGGLARASYEELSVECGSPERVEIGQEDGAPAAADMTESIYVATELDCEANGVVTVSVNPIWGERSIVGSALLVRQGGKAVLAGSLKRDEYDGKDWSRVAWSRALCAPS